MNTEVKPGQLPKIKKGNKEVKDRQDSTEKKKDSKSHEGRENRIRNQQPK